MKLLNEGLQYRLLIDPFLDSMHSIAASMIEPGQKVIDVACGNGTLTIKMADKAGHATGIDLSEGSLEFARKRARKLGMENTHFRLQDANDLIEYQDNTFDVATISMAIHQFSPEIGLHILKQLQRIAGSLLVIDYAFPQPRNYKGFFVRSIERIAGKEHFTNFNAYLHGGGIKRVLEVLRLEASETVLSSNRVFEVIKVPKT